MLSKELSSESPIHPLLSLLKLMNLHVSGDDLTADKDYKHVFRRLHSLFIWQSGIFIAGIHITLSILSNHLASNGLHLYQIQSLLNLSNKQDVVLMFKLLQAVWSLPPPTPADHEKHLGYAQACIALNLLGQMCFYLVMPYLNIDLSLWEQLEYLSAAAHICLALFTHDSAQTKLMPFQLYGDIMIMIKNVYFSVAKVKTMYLAQDHDFWIILLGTDHLEVNFGIVRTENGNDTNVDVLQLLDKLSHITEISTILTKHPEWDRAPQRLHLKPIMNDNIDSNNLTQEHDHINPVSWNGDMNVQHVILATCWKLGQDLVEGSLATLDPQLVEGLEKVECAQCDILQPFGDLITKSMGDKASCEDDVTKAPIMQDIGSDGISMLAGLAEIKDEASITNIEEHPKSGSTMSSHMPYIMIGGKKAYKGCLLKAYFMSRAGSTD